MPKTAEQMREMRRKYGLGEFAKKGALFGKPAKNAKQPRRRKGKRPGPHGWRNPNMPVLH